MNNLVLPKEQHWLLGAMLPPAPVLPHTQPSPSSTLPLSPGAVGAPGAEPWLPEPGLGSLPAAEQDTAALPAQPGGCPEPSTALLLCSWPREAAPAGIALALPSASLLRARRARGSSCRVKLHFTFQMLRFKDWSFHGPRAWPHCWWTWFG